MSEPWLQDLTTKVREATIVVISCTKPGHGWWKMKLQGGRLPQFLQLLESGEPEPVAYLREVDAGTDNACWVVCAKGDPGARAVFMGEV